MIVDSLTYLGESLFGSDTHVADLLTALDGAGIDRAIVCPMKPPNYVLRPANERLAESVQRHPDRLVGLARVDPNRGQEACDDLLYCLEELGLAGLFLHPWEECFPITSPRVRPLLDIARQRRIPVVVASGYPWLSEALQVGAVAREYPDVTLVATNGCQINISGLGTFDAFEALAGNANLMIQTAGVYRQDFIEEVIKRHGAGRVLYSSAFPYMDPRLELMRVSHANCDQSTKDQLAGSTAAAVFGLEAQ
jgi:predicted TIM-barrel fold metal-dependent hydrolase